MNRVYSKPSSVWDFPIELPYSHGVKCGGLIFIGGQVALDKSGNVLFPNDLVRQTELVMESMKAVLMDLGATLDDVVKINRFYVGTGTQENWAESANACAKYFRRPGPVATGIPVPVLAMEGLMIEIEAIAMVKV
jgi:enamine deaminase RidA (YjgF/YER057c/UK114 family)